MIYSQFIRHINTSLAGSEVLRQEMYYGHLLQQTDRGVLINRHPTEILSLEEAKQYIYQQKIQQELQEEIQQEQYTEISSTKIVDIIKNYHTDVKVTDTLLESYVELASSSVFSLDPVVTDIRKLNKLDRLVELRFDFKLNDGSVIVITEETQTKLNNIFSRHSDVVEYMKQNKESFLSVLDQLED